MDHTSKSMGGQNKKEKRQSVLEDNFKFYKIIFLTELVLH